MPVKAMLHDPVGYFSTNVNINCVQVKEAS